MKYFRLREKVIQYISQLKSNYLNSCSKSSGEKYQWSVINELLGRSKRKTVDVNVQDLATVFADVYVADKSIDDLDVDSLASKPLHVAQSDVMEVVRSLKKGSPGPDEFLFGC